MSWHWILALGFGMLAHSGCFGAITYISIPKESQDFGNNDSYPARDNIWTVSIPPTPFNTDTGAGRLVNLSAEGLQADIDVATRLFSLNSHKYAADYAPVSTAVVTYVFDVPTTVAGLEVVQHQNGVSKIEGFAGNQLSAMTSLGNVLGPRGDVRGGGIFAEGETNVFEFPNRVSGTIFQFRITQTSLARGYAIYRAFPRSEAGERLLSAGDALTRVRVSEIEISWWSTLGTSYNVEYRTEADANTWLRLYEGVIGTGGELSVADRPPRQGLRRFYRVAPTAAQ